MKQFHIGLDFGTFQSKACVYSIDEVSYEFFKFQNGTFFLPSRVAKMPNGKFEYGNISSSVMEEYYYFKIASAEDDEFHFETTGKKDADNFYKFNEFQNYSPEFLSVVYLTYILFSIKEKYQLPSKAKVSSGGLLDRFRAKPKETDEVEFSVEIGIPTEWSQEKNLKRKRKFENILMLSELLQQKYKSKSSFLEISCDQLVEDVKGLNKTLKFSDLSEYLERLNSLKISVYPETAAGLAFILRTKQLDPGYYAIMDIGGGSTDISFFSIEANRDKVRYFASESYIMAANNVYLNYKGLTDSIKVLQESENEVQEIISNGSWETDKALKKALHIVNDELKRLVKNLFNKRVYYHQAHMTNSFSEQPIIIYGGGGKLPVIDSGEILIHDNGNPSSITIPLTYLQKQKISKFSSLITIKPSDKSWDPDFPLLAVALGLSFIKPASSAEWFNEKDYKTHDYDTANVVAHPANEDCYVFDVINSKWV